MELKTYFAQDASGNIMPGATVTVYEAGTATLATGLQDESGSPLANPFTADSSAKVAFYAPDGLYDITVVGNGRTVTIRAQFVSVDGASVLRDDLAAAGGSSLVGFQPSGTGAVPTNVQVKLRELRTPVDWGGTPSRCLGVGVNVLPPNGPPTIDNVALGTNILQSLTTGYANIGIGVDVLSFNTSGSFNIAIGARAMWKNTTGLGNTAFGAYSTYENKTGSANTAYGEDSNRYLDGGNSNVAVGTQSLYNNVTGTENTAVGTYAARNAANPPDDGAGTGPSPNFITAVGAMALYNAAGTLNVGVGHSAGYNATGSYNTYVGANSGDQITSGSYNTIVGRFNGNSGGLDIRTASNYVVLSDGAGNVRAHWNGENAVFNGSLQVGQGAGSNTFGAGNFIGASTFGQYKGFFWQQNGSDDLDLWLGNGVSVFGKVATFGYSSGFAFGGNVRPDFDNVHASGSASLRWSVVYAGTGVINTSDEREKQDIATLEPAELRVAAALKLLVKKFRFKNAVQAKGDAARIHVGVLAQDVMAAFQSEGLDPMRYGIVCYDEWDAEGDEPAGNRYGVRYEELLAFIISAL